MNIQPYQRVDRGKHPEIPEAVWQALDPMSKALEEITQGLQGRLSDADNQNAEIRELALIDRTPQEIELQRVRGKAEEVRAIWCEDASQPLPGIAWNWVDESRIEVTAFWTVTPETALTVRLKIKGS